MKSLQDSTVDVYGTAADSWKYATERSFSDNWRYVSRVLACCIVRRAEGHAAGRTSGKRSLRDRTSLKLRADIPALQDDVYLNFGAHGPSPEYVVDATDEFVRSHEYDTPVADNPYDTTFRAFDRTRETVASFIGAESEEIVLTESTTAGSNAIANAIDWQPGDVVVRTDLEHRGDPSVATARAGGHQGSRRRDRGRSNRSRTLRRGRR